MAKVCFGCLTGECWRRRCEKFWRSLFNLPLVFISSLHTSHTSASFALGVWDEESVGSSQFPVGRSGFFYQIRNFLSCPPCGPTASYLVPEFLASYAPLSTLCHRSDGPLSCG